MNNGYEILYHPRRLFLLLVLVFIGVASTGCKSSRNVVEETRTEYHYTGQDSARVDSMLMGGNERSSESDTTNISTDVRGSVEIKRDSVGRPIFLYWTYSGNLWGVKGAAAATVLSQYVSGFGMMGYTLFCCPKLRVRKEHMRWRPEALKEIIGMSFLTCTQQSVMNLGILMVQGLVNSFGAVVMAAFAVAVKIDSFAYMPVQDFGNAFSTYVAQNYGAGREDRIRKGIRSAGALVFVFCICISLMVCLFARPLMEIFVSGKEVEIIETGVCYLRIEGAFYVGIGVLFLLYGFYRAVRRPGMSVALTMISLGIRVALAYLLSSAAWIGVIGIWIAVPIGWALADVTGVGYYWWRYRKGNG